MHLPKLPDELLGSIGGPGIASYDQVHYGACGFQHLPDDMAFVLANKVERNLRHTV